jgi:hypothetical protein
VPIKKRRECQFGRNLEITSLATEHVTTQEYGAMGQAETASSFKKWAHKGYEDFDEERSKGLCMEFKSKVERIT